MSKPETVSPTPLTDADREILRMVQADLPDGPEPFAAIAAAVGVSEEHVLDLLRRMKESGEIRRFGATLRHQKAGYSANAMVAWRVPAEIVDAAGEKMAERPEISHCYIRLTTPEWPYNLYTMIHAKTPEECERAIKDIAAYAGLDDYDVLLSRKELKKTSMQYF